MSKKLSIEESLALLKKDSSPSRSPLRARKTQRSKKNGKDISGEDKPDDDIFDLLESPISIGSPSPVAKPAPSPTPSEGEDESEEDEPAPPSEGEDESEENESEDEPAPSPVPPPVAREDESEDEPALSEGEDESEENESEDEPAPSPAPSTGEDESEDESEEDDEVELKSSRKILPITPKRFTVSSPRTPTEKLEKRKRGRKNDSFIQKLKDFRYSITRMVYMDGGLKYVVCYDPYGQIVFVSVPDGTEDEIIRNKKSENVEKIDTVKITTVPEKLDNPLDEAFVNAVKERVNMTVFGLIFYNGFDYQICERNRKGFFKDRYCSLRGDSKDGKLSLPQTFIVTLFSDILEDHFLVIENNKENYEKIQRQQLENSNHTFKEIVRSLREAEEHMVKFKDVYQKHSKGIMSDWNVMGSQAKEFYKKYSDQTLEEDEREEYDKISINMFLRFQFFNQNIELMDKLQSIKNYLDQTTGVLSDAIDEIGEKDENVRHKLVERDEIDRYI